MVNYNLLILFSICMRVVYVNKFISAIHAINFEIFQMIFISFPSAQINLVVIMYLEEIALLIGG